MTPNLPLEVFIVEDNLDAAENLRDILELDEHRVTIAFTAAAAFSSPAIASAEVILLDWKLPDASAAARPCTAKRCPCVQDGRTGCTSNALATTVAALPGRSIGAILAT